MDDCENHWQEDLYNVGIVGKTGAGKSTLINAYFGFPEREEEAAKSDVVECTKTPHPYHLPGCPLALWDTPGYGSQGVPADDSYFDKFHFRNYDFYILVSCSKVNEFEEKVIETMRRMNKRFFYVRTKVAQEINGLCKSRRHAPSRDSVVEEIRTQIGKSIQETQVFLVKSPERETLDFPNLKALAKDAARLSVEEYRLAKFQTRVKRTSNSASAKDCNIL